MPNPAGAAIVATGISADPYPPDVGRRIFCFSDGYRIAFFQTGAGTYYSTSATGATWSAAVQITANLAFNVPSSMSQVQDTIHLWYMSGYPMGTYQVQMPWNAGTHTMGTLITSAPTYIYYGYYARFYYIYDKLDAVWDSFRSIWHLVLGYNTAGSSVPAISLAMLGNATAGQQVPVYYTVDQIWTGSTWTRIRGRIVGSKSVLHVSVADDSRNGTYLLPVTVQGNPGAPNSYVYQWQQGQAELAYPASVEHVTTYDVNGNLNFALFQSPAGGVAQLLALLRTGVATYSAPIDLYNPATTVNYPVTSYDTASGDLYTFYVNATQQPSTGEIYLSQRKAGSWQPAQLIAGQDGGGYNHPSCIDTFNSGGSTNNTADLLYVSGTGPYTLYYLGVSPGSAPNTPTNLAQVGNYGSAAVVPSPGPKPVFSWTYSNSAANDLQSGYEIKVLQTAAGLGSTTVTSETNSTTLVLASAAGCVVNEWITVSQGANNDTTQITAIASNTVTLSPALTHTYTNGATVVPASSLVVWDSGRVTSGNAANITYGAVSNAADGNYIAPKNLAYTVTYQWQVRTWDTLKSLASSYANLVSITAFHSPTITIQQVFSNTSPATSTTSSPTPVGTPNISVKFLYTSPDGTLGASYSLFLYGTDQTTVVAFIPGANFSPQLASGASFTTGAWDLTAGGTIPISNNAVYYLRAFIYDAHGNGSPASAFWRLNTSWASPAAVTGLTATPNTSTGSVRLAWTNPVDTSVISESIFWRPSGTATWIPVAAGSVRTNIQMFPPPLVAYDYAVSTLSKLGIASTMQVVSGVILGPKLGRYGMWLNDVTDPLNTAVALGAVESWDSSTAWTHIEDALRFVPVGKTKPITSYGLADFWMSGRSGTAASSNPTASTMTFYVPTIDSDGTTRVNAKDVAAMIQKMVTSHRTLLYRDVTGISRFVLIEEFSPAPADPGTAFTVQFTLTETAYPGGPVSV